MNRALSIATRGALGTALSVATFGYFGYSMEPPPDIIGKVCIGTITMTTTGATIAATLPGATLRLTTTGATIEFEDCS